jgi:hypothetical protein
MVLFWICVFVLNRFLLDVTLYWIFILYPTDQTDYLIKADFHAIQIQFYIGFTVC